MKFIIYLMIMICVAAYPQNWVNSGTMVQPVVSGGEAVSADTEIYILGGFSESHNSSIDDIRIYYPGSNTWHNKTKMDEKRSFFTSGMYNDSVFFFGGVSGNNNEGKTLEIWNRINKPQKYSEDDVFNRSNTAGVILNGHFYFFGGTSTLPGIYYLVDYDIPEKNINYFNNSIFSYIPAQQMCATDGNFIYLFGGVFMGISKNIYRYNPADKSFLKLNISLQTARAGGRAVLIDSSRILIIGGYNETQNALASTEIFTINNGSYSISPGPSLLAPRKNFMACNVSGKLYVLGGKNDSDEEVNNIEGLNPVTDVKDNEPLPQITNLVNNYPNPFNPNTTISYTIRKRSWINLKIYNSLGELITELLNKEMPPGSYNEVFDARIYQLPSGVYFYNLSVDGYIESKKMVLIK